MFSFKLHTATPMVGKQHNILLRGRKTHEECKQNLVQHKRNHTVTTMKPTLTDQRAQEGK